MMQLQEMYGLEGSGLRVLVAKRNGEHLSRYKELVSINTLNALPVWGAQVCYPYIGVRTKQKLYNDILLCHQGNEDLSSRIIIQYNYSPRYHSMYIPSLLFYSGNVQDLVDEEEIGEKKSRKSKHSFESS
jgi:hypothetical protein